MAEGGAKTGELPEAIRRWRSRLRFRVVGGAMLAAVAAPIEGTWAAAFWFGGVVALEGVSALVIDRARRGSGDWAQLMRAGCAMVFASYALVSALAAAVAAPGTAAGLSLAYAIGGMSLVSLVLASAGQRGMFLAGLAPMFLTMGLALPLSAIRGGTSALEAVSLAVAGVGSVLVCVSVWRWFGQILEGETAARAQAEAATLAKSRLVATISHELRTPINAIQAGATAIGPANPQADLILEASRMMRTLLDDLLDQSKLEAGRLSIERAEFGLRQALASAIRFWRAEARRKNVRFRLEGGRGLPAYATGDETRLRQILNNLLSNACKFSADGAVTVRAAYDANTLRIVVQDTGIGMSEAQMQRLFQPFSQADDSVARTYGGTGLGLAISRDLAVAMGGELTVTSQLGRGAAFTLTVPLPTATEPPPQVAPDAEPFDFAGLRVLVADDHEVNRRVMTLVLGQLGVEPTLVGDGHAALEALEAEPFDVVMLDVNMPGLDGYETARRLRLGDGPNAKAPIAAVTGALTEDDEVRRRQAGIGFVVAKPIDPAQLLSVLREASQVASATEAAREQAA